MANTTTDHGEIRKWVEARGGCPAHVKRTGADGDGDPGILRIDFPGFSGQQSLESIGWNEFFEWFDKNQLAFIYQDRTSNGKQSRFNKLVSRDNPKLPRGRQSRGGKATKQAASSAQPDALELLESQHRQVEELFDRLSALTPRDREFNQLLAEVGDALAVHASIEEQIFYPAVEDRQTEKFLEQAVEDHLQVKRVLATILQNARSQDVAGEIEELAGLTEEHVIEEEMELFPKVRKLFEAAELRELAYQMTRLEAQLREKGDPRLQTRNELEAPASL